MKLYIRQLMIILLASWLPLQALAGVLSHCDQLSSMTSLSVHGHASEQSTDQSNEPDCHGQTVTLNNHSSTDNNQDTSSSSCFHCDGNCHGAQSFNMPVSEQSHETPANNDFAQLQQSALSGFARSLHRPPCRFSPA